MTVGEYGAFLADLHPAFDPARYAAFLQFFSLAESDRIGHLSTGRSAGGAGRRVCQRRTIT